ncbi:unnamed protein product [Spirodela intermedia]|uniref:NmrA-like domain-containing protein n=1 Tax=Spirodela intermedia TaxID=51605 RepID=A0A7I8KTQ5_SPIIN|nr:unnamed protein product [Spirodela intermedia]
MGEAAVSFDVAPAATIGGAATLIAGATGFIGKFVAEASIARGVPTYVLRRPGASAAAPSKEAVIRSLQQKGAVVIEGYANDKDFIEKKLKELNIEVVISVLGGRNLLDQLPLIEAIKAAGTVKRFLPSEFGNDVDRANPVEPGLRVYEEKRKVRRAVEAAGVPFTYICCNSIAGWPYYEQYDHCEAVPPLEKFSIYGDGNMKAYFVACCDIGKFAIMAAHDDRTINKTVHFRPPCNFLSMNELATLWENKIGRSLPRIAVSEAALLAAAAENRIPESFVASFTHDVFFKGCQQNFSIDGRQDLEVTELYPGVTFRTMEECFEDFAAGILGEEIGRTELPAYEKICHSKREKEREREIIRA